MPTCAICEKAVYAVEELKALSKIYHKTCFRCGGKAKDGCNKKLALSDYVEHDNEPYCKYCHSKLFGTVGGHRQGMINSAPIDRSVKKDDDTADSEESPIKANPFLEKDKVRRASLGKGGPPTPPVAASASAPVPAPAPAAVSASTAAPVPSKSVANPCAFCGKTVYHVEQLKALGVVWHKRCFKCSGTNKDGCLKVLSLTDYVDHGNMPYCRNCHTKMFGPKGSNSRLGSSIAHSNDTVQRRQSVVVESEEPADKNLASAISNLKVVGETSTVKKEEASPQLLDAIEGSVFNATAGGLGPGQDNQRRPSLKVGGNLMNEVHKEAAYVGDNDEVDEDEWT